MRWVLDFNKPVWISFDCQVLSQTSLDSIFVVKSESFVDLVCLLVSELDLAFVWSNEFSIFLIKPINLLVGSCHRYGMFPASKLLLRSTNEHLLMVILAWLKNCESYIKGFPFVIDLSYLGLLSTE